MWGSSLLNSFNLYCNHILLITVPHDYHDSPTETLNTPILLMMVLHITYDRPSHEERREVTFQTDGDLPVWG